MRQPMRGIAMCAIVFNGPFLEHGLTRCMSQSGGGPLRGAPLGANAKCVSLCLWGTHVVSVSAFNCLHPTSTLLK